jgi:hypothetical protein
MTRCLFENLEGRRLMDATMSLLSSPTAEPMPAPAIELHAETRGASRASAPNIIGTWQGTVTVGVGSSASTMSFRLQVTKQTKTTLTGPLTIGQQTYKGTGTVRWAGRNFTIRYAKGNISLTLQGSVNAARNSMSATASMMGKAIGKMSATKVA